MTEYHINFTKRSIEQIPTPPPGKRLTYHDTKLKGLSVRVTANSKKTFLVRKRINGVSKRITIGNFPELTIEQVRNQARVHIGEIALGIDPLAKRREKKAKVVTLGEVLTDYLETRKSLSEKTIKDYQRVIDVALSDWKEKPLSTISKDKVEEQHKILGAQGPAWANLSMRVLRALFNFAANKYEDSEGRSLFPENPVKRLSSTRAWYKVERRTGFIKSTDLKGWFDTVIELPMTSPSVNGALIRDYLMLLLFTGLRKTEAASLKWDQIDMASKTLTAIDTKNGRDHTLPLSDFLYRLLANRRIETTSEFVFPGPGNLGYLQEPKRQITRVAKVSGIKFTCHDLRRTFVTIAESLDIPAYALKRLLNHKSSDDVTAGYIVMDVDRLRVPMQKITQHILSVAGRTPEVPTLTATVNR